MSEMLISLFFYAILKISYVPVNGDEGPFITWTAYDSDQGAAVLKAGDYVVAVFFLEPETRNFYRLIVTPDGLEETEETVTEILEGTDEARKEKIIYHLDPGQIIPLDFSDLNLGFLEMVS